MEFEEGGEVSVCSGVEEKIVIQTGRRVVGCVTTHVLDIE